MKRDKETYPKVKPYKSYLFWNECRFCHKEFRKEQGFKIIDYKACKYGENNPFFTSYCCNDCGNNIEDVKSKIHKEKDYFLNNKPKALYNNKDVNSNQHMDEVYNYLKELYKNEDKWIYTKNFYNQKLENNENAKENIGYAIGLLLMIEYEKIKKHE